MSKLDERIKQYEIPAFPYGTIGDICLVYRIPGEEKTAGGLLYVPETSKEVKERAVLLSAGLTALDALADHQIELGDIVVIARYAGTERVESRDAGEAGKAFMRMKVGDIQGSEDLPERLKAYVLCRETEGEAAGQHYYVKRDEMTEEDKRKVVK